MTKNDKLTEENLHADDHTVHADDQTVNGAQSEVHNDNVSEDEQGIGNPSYEELLDKKEELEESLLRANAELDNAFKRSLIEVEKAHKYLSLIHISEPTRPY